MQNSLLAINLKSILSKIFEVEKSKSCFVLFDEESELARLLTQTYREVLPRAQFRKFQAEEEKQITEIFNQLSPGDLVILIQSTNFRLDAFRIRVHLFNLKLKVIEHLHISRVKPEEIPTYIASLAYNPSYYRPLGNALKKALNKALQVRVCGEGKELVYQGPFEEAKMNIGDYSENKNVGSQFPIGEVFSELKDLKGLNGQLPIFAFGDRNFGVSDANPSILLHIQEGRVVKVENSNEEFDAVLQEIRDHEGEIWARELGLGLNRALTREVRIEKDVGMYERMCGVHVSLGAKHSLYPKAGFHKKQVKFHVDIFAAVDEVWIDDQLVFQNGSYLSLK